VCRFFPRFNKSLTKLSDVYRKRKAMRGHLIILIFCVITAHSARAGAWLREPDSAFSSATVTLRKLNGLWQSESGIYGEYGVTPSLTLGLDFNETPTIAGHFLVFARVPVRAAKGRTKVSLEVAVGGHHRQGQWGAMAKSTISVGRGFTSRWGAGWFNIDGSLELRRPNSDPIYKLDATLGLSSARRIRPILQFESTHIRDSPLIWSVTPGMLIEGRNNTTWLLGLERKTATQSTLGVKFGLWRQF
jgi:hypothetical protein